MTPRESAAPRECMASSSTSKPPIKRSHRAYQPCPTGTMSSPDVDYGCAIVRPPSLSQRRRRAVTLIRGSWISIAPERSVEPQVSCGPVNLRPRQKRKQSRSSPVTPGPRAHAALRLRGLHRRGLTPLADARRRLFCMRQLRTEHQTKVTRVANGEAHVRLTHCGERCPRVAHVCGSLLERSRERHDARAATSASKLARSGKCRAGAAWETRRRRASSRVETAAGPC